ncbi:MAG TPA: 2-oxo-4-hydroxy-4-carboxy-5-ureidoimidazoline decarboxylase [Pyrinomonadaceae bacterium]|nr:2-oxo-4-hydroxy-4-carboxy-5-ureidoimidazoline decarboxylase [Pyrinomonadaceae bacterium]
MDESTDRLQHLNLLSATAAAQEFLKCCGSRGWAHRMADSRSYQNAKELLATANQVWWSLDPQDWLEAFHSHPKIGEKKAAAATAVEAQQWSADEQSGIGGSAQRTLAELAELNREYEKKFGYIFIVCATGKSSEEMLSILRERLGNNPAEELRIAAAEQAKITELRLKKLLAT